MFRVINADESNAWGVPRGYGIFHGATTSQLLPPSHPLLKRASLSPSRHNPFKCCYFCGSSRQEARSATVLAVRGSV